MRLPNATWDSSMKTDGVSLKIAPKLLRGIGLPLCAGLKPEKTLWRFRLPCYPTRFKEQKCSTRHWQPDGYTERAEEGAASSPVSVVETLQILAGSVDAPPQG